MKAIKNFVKEASWYILFVSLMLSFVAMINFDLYCVQDVKNLVITNPNQALSLVALFFMFALPNLIAFGVWLVINKTAEKNNRSLVKEILGLPGELKILASTIYLAFGATTFFVGSLYYHWESPSAIRIIVGLIMTASTFYSAYLLFTIKPYSGLMQKQS